ncbi:MAG: aspartyl protease family protein [Bacteroidetes bacterium]|nr:aspartyl protease family protein [Bacteroidota bacterium]
MLIDTGASKTVFDKKRISNFLKEEKFETHDKLSTGLETSNMKSHLVVIKKISIGTLEIKNYKSVVIDISHMNAAYSHMKQKPIEGVLGSDILKQHKAVVDYGKKTLRLH